MSRHDRHDINSDDRANRLRWVSPPGLSSVTIGQSEERQQGMCLFASFDIRGARCFGVGEGVDLFVLISAGLGVL